MLRCSKLVTSVARESYTYKLVSGKIHLLTINIGRRLSALVRSPVIDVNATGKYVYTYQQLRPCANWVASLMIMPRNPMACRCLHILPFQLAPSPILYLSHHRSMHPLKLTGDQWREACQMLPCKKTSMAMSMVSRRISLS